IELDQEKWPGCVYHRTAPNDVARTEHLTYICTSTKKMAGPTNNWMPPDEAYKKAGQFFYGSMRGRTMYVVPFSMGPIGSPFSKIGVQLTDSIYVVLNMRIMTRMGTAVLKKLGTNGKFTKCLHGKADLDEKKRLILHFPEDNTIWSVGSGYGGNVLLGKKCLALRIASYLARQEGWLAEHMLIMGVEDPSGRITYIAGAFPSACGKTNLAMLIPPESMKHKSYRIWTVGDDIAWMRIDTDGRLWAINPETGFFGVAPGTNYQTNRNAMETIKKNTIFTNVLLTKDKNIWWEGMDGEPLQEGINWEGKPWRPGMVDKKGNIVLGAHPNSRFTAPISQCPSISNRIEHHHGVLIDAIIFGGRRPHTVPLIYESFDWKHGVFIGATMASERTAAQYGKQGEIRRDPMAMFPFCGYNMGMYFQHWFDMGKKMEKPPKIFHVNWFRTDKDGNYLWPGFGENLRILEWIIGRCIKTAGARITPIGYVPKPEDLDLTGLSMSKETIEELLYVDKGAWLEEAKDIERFFKTFGSDLPVELKNELKALQERLMKE
ncbi:MAG TPA: phosphoenolpyruvate carboxykinase (GTP), partial [Syntrophorhabdaceae bacterium]|nr:phosphoenolpyruvate carboxykinase (GTP) [Syntrophorhabdaceae bacterium]